MDNNLGCETVEDTKRYHELFNGVSCPPESIRYKALHQALDTRKFEIEMYWKRATYFWTLIAASLVGYGIVTNAAAAAAPSAERDLVRCVISALGFLFSFAWILVNKGSKQWQENWENHVDLLEDVVLGPLHKTVLRRPRASGFDRIKGVIAGPAAFSVSAINQIISYFTCLVWVVLFYQTLPPLSFGMNAVLSAEWLVGALLGASVILMFWAGRTHVEDHGNRVKLRKSRVEELETNPLQLDELQSAVDVGQSDIAEKQGSE